MSRRKIYRTRYAARRAGGKRAAGWLVTALAAGLALYVALAMGAGSWLHDALTADRTPQENEIEDAEAAAEEDAPAITETVAFPAMEGYALAVSGFPTEQAARDGAALYAARGGAGYVSPGDNGEFRVLLAVYERQMDAQSVADALKEGENIAAQVLPISADAVELKLTAQPRRIDGIRDAFAIWQQTQQMLTALWQDVDGGLCNASQARDRVRDQRGKLQAVCQTAFSGALIEGQAAALNGLDGALRAALQEMEGILEESTENVLEVSAKIKYTGIRSLIEYQTYVETLKTQAN